MNSSYDVWIYLILHNGCMVLLPSVQDKFQRQLYLESVIGIDHGILKVFDGSILMYTEDISGLSPNYEAIDKVTRHIFDVVLKQ